MSWYPQEGNYFSAAYFWGTKGKDKIGIQLSQASSWSSLMLHFRSRWTSPEEGKRPSPELQRCCPDFSSVEHLSFHFRQTEAKNKGHSCSFVRSCVPASQETMLVWGWTLRKALGICPHGSTAIVHSAPSSWEQGRSWNRLCLVTVTSCEFQPSIPVQGPGWQWEHSYQWWNSFLLAPVGELADLFASYCLGEWQRGILCLRECLHSPTQPHHSQLTFLLLSGPPPTTTSSNPAECGQDLKEIKREGRSYWIKR